MGKVNSLKERLCIKGQNIIEIPRNFIGILNLKNIKI